MRAPCCAVHLDFPLPCRLVQKALEVCPDHGDSQELLKTVKAAFTSV